MNRGDLPSGQTRFAPFVVAHAPRDRRCRTENVKREIRRLWNPTLASLSGENGFTAKPLIEAKGELRSEPWEGASKARGRERLHREGAARTGTRGLTAQKQLGFRRANPGTPGEPEILGNG